MPLLSIMHMLRHYGGLPIIDRVIAADDEMPKRATLQETVDFIIGLLMMS
ncbi:MAG: hypothetical protein V8Q76_15595 [Bacteroides intestinalis]